MRVHSGVLGFSHGFTLVKRDSEEIMIRKDLTYLSNHMNCFGATKKTAGGHVFPLFVEDGLLLSRELRSFVL
jgi:hypothetical protein